MIEKIVIENLVNRYHQYWQQSDIDGLMSMYDKEITYHDMPSGDVMRYQDMKKFLPRSFAAEQNQNLKPKDSAYIEGNPAFIYPHGDAVGDGVTQQMMQRVFIGRIHGVRCD